MKVDVLLGLQWGDEGKGKVVDVLTPKYDIIARFQGGPNAGHTLEFNNIKHVLHIIPSGIFRDGTINIVGNGVVIDPVVFKKEVDAIAAMGIDIHKHLFISQKAHLILPSHKALDAASEASKGGSKIGSTLRGIGPSYMDKTGRNGLRVGDILTDTFKNKYNFLVSKHKEMLKAYNYETNLDALEAEWFTGIECMRKFKLIESEVFINEQLAQGKTVLAEGAQGTLLDIDFGTYPFVTSSSTICAGACTGLGIAPQRIKETFGIFKAYCTRVGSGPFPTELLDNTGEMLRKKGNEFGATTGRPRRCGWLDLPALKYSIMINGVTQLIMTKADVLSGFESINVCTEYKTKDKTISHFPYDSSTVSPVYKEFKGWSTNLTGITSFNQLPAEFIQYINFIEKEVKVPVTIISTGPNRDHLIIK